VNETKYPLLPPLAQDLLSAHASEAYVERVFLWRADSWQEKQANERHWEKNFLQNEQEILWTRMRANAQRDDRPVEHRWRPLFNAAKFGWRPLL